MAHDPRKEGPASPVKETVSMTTTKAPVFVGAVRKGLGERLRVAWVFSDPGRSPWAGGGSSASCLEGQVMQPAFGCCWWSLVGAEGSDWGSSAVGLTSSPGSSVCLRPSECHQREHSCAGLQYTISTFRTSLITYMYTDRTHGRSTTEPHSQPHPFYFSNCPIILMC